MKLPRANYKPWQKGLLIGWGLLMTWLAYLTGDIAFSYAGQCGGLMPFVSRPRPCAFAEYFQDSVSFTLKIILYEFWLSILGWLILSTLVGWGIGRYYRTRSGN
ncbi:MAG: hypothetical protein IIA62_04295 [Nitrospinae bacterium]|nr:hypothetical protein [Nitrospinota bacterium]